METKIKIEEIDKDVYELSTGDGVVNNMTKKQAAKEYAKKVATNNKDMQIMAYQDFLEGVKWAEVQFTNNATLMIDELIIEVCEKQRTIIKNEVLKFANKKNIYDVIMTIENAGYPKIELLEKSATIRKS